MSDARVTPSPSPRWVRRSGHARLCSPPCACRAGRLRGTGRNEPRRPQGRAGRARPQRHHHRRPELADAQRALRERAVRPLRRAPRGRPEPDAQDYGGAEGDPDLPLRAGRAVLHPWTQHRAARVHAGRRRLRLRVSLPRGRRASAGAIRPPRPHRRGPLQLVSRGGLRVPGRAGSRPAGWHHDAAVREDRGRLRPGLPARRQPRAVQVHPDRRAGGLRHGDAVSVARHRRSAGGHPPGSSSPKRASSTWWRRGSRSR